jgi:hypothetical protein
MPVFPLSDSCSLYVTRVRIMATKSRTSRDVLMSVVLTKKEIVRNVFVCFLSNRR